MKIDQLPLDFAGASDGMLPTTSCSEFEFATVAGRGNKQSRGCPPKSVTAGETAHHSMYPNGECPNCGGKLHGDGYNAVLRCENAEDDAYWYAEPDARPVYCIPNSD